MGGWWTDWDVWPLQNALGERCQRPTGSNCPRFRCGRQVCPSTPKTAWSRGPRPRGAMALKFKDWKQVLAGEDQELWTAALQAKLGRIGMHGNAWSQTESRPAKPPPGPLCFYRALTWHSARPGMQGSSPYPRILLPPSNHPEVLAGLSSDYQGYASNHQRLRSYYDTFLNG